MRDKWNAKNKKGYLKIHVAVNVKTKKILSMKVTDERVHDSKALPILVGSILKSDKTVGKVFADGAYDNNDIFRCLTDNGIRPCIKVRMNSRVRLKKEETSLEIYQSWHKEMICKDGKIALDMDKDGLLKLCSLV